MRNLLIIFAVSLFSLTACAYEKPIEVNQLPVAATEFVKTYFADATVALAKEEVDDLVKTYEVMFNNGGKVEFRSNGEWKSVEYPMGLPAGIVPAQIMDYVTKTYPAQKVLKIDKDRRDYEIELDNRLDLKFNLQFQLIDIDD